MLVLSIREGEKIYVGNDIVITVIEWSHHQCRVGIDAPKEIPVHREDVHNRIEEAKKQAKEMEGG